MSYSVPDMQAMLDELARQKAEAKGPATFRPEFFAPHEGTSVQPLPQNAPPNLIPFPQAAPQPRKAEPGPPPTPARGRAEAGDKAAAPALSGFDSFAEGALRENAPRLPRGAKNILKTIISKRDPETGRASELISYTLDEEPSDGTELSRESPQQPTGSD